MDLFDLHGKVAIVTGGNGGLGRGMAWGLARAGADIVIAARDQAKTAATAAELRDTCGVQVLELRRQPVKPKCLSLGRSGLCPMPSGTGFYLALRDRRCLTGRRWLLGDGSLIQAGRNPPPG